MENNESNPNPLTQAIDARTLARRLELLEISLAYLRLADDARKNSGLQDNSFEPLISKAQDELELLRQKRFGIIPGRRRAKVQSSETYTIFVDECGNHALNAKEKFKAFCLSAVIVNDKDYPQFDSDWKRWKATYLRSSESLVHEPDVRAECGSFYLNNDILRRKSAIAGLDAAIENANFIGSVCVINMPEYAKLIGKGSLDCSLPRHCYLMAVQFLAERVALILQEECGGAIGRFVFESRGRKEDALIQSEFARLFFHGTSYLSDQYFRNQFFPGMEFMRKGDNNSGLQFADLQARPCADKVLAPDTTPPRWVPFSKKLSQYKRTGHSTLGFKVVPWDDRYTDIWIPPKT